MEKWQTTISKPIILNIDHIDTDMIIPAQYLTSTLSTGYSEGLFKRLKEQNPDFPFNTIKLGEKRILITGENFGCGSSREHAAWAIKEFGINAIIAKSFADIFKSNAQKNGILPIVIDDLKIHKNLLELDTNAILTISLENNSIEVNNSFLCKFQIDSFRRHCLLNGIDDLDYILSYKENILEYRNKMENLRFFNTEWIKNK